MYKRLTFAIALLLVMVMVAPLAAVSAQDDAVILRYPINPDPEHLNPFTATTIAIGVINRNIYEGLVSVNTNTGEILPGLAESWEVSEDGLTYTFTLREGVLFHDAEGVDWGENGREFNAEDVIWAAHLSNTEDETISQNPNWTDNIVGAEAHRTGDAETIEGITMVDDFTIEVQLESPDRLFLINGFGGIPAVPQEAYEQLGDDFGNNPVGTGPFVFEEWRRDDTLTLTANSEYWNEGQPAVDGIEFINVPDSNTALLLYREGDLDFLFGFPTGQRGAVLEEFADQAQERPGLNVRYFGFDMSQGFFAENPLVRQAFNYAFNRELVWDQLMEGARFPADLGVLPPSMPASTPDTIYTYDMERAAELLAEAGFPEGEGMPTIELYIFASGRDELSFPVLQQDLATLGVDLEIVIEDNSTYWDHIGQDDVIFFLSGWSAGLVDPSDVMDFLLYEGRDDTYYDNPEVNALLEQARAEFDDSAREAIYQEAHNLIMADAPWIVSAYSKVTWLQQPWIEGFAPGGGGTHTADLAAVTSSR